MTEPLTAPFSELARPSRLGPLLVAATGDERWAEPEVTLITGGKSNLTFELRSAAGSLILRRPPDGHILPTAHDMAREARVQQALEPTSVPVAHVVLEDSGAALGVPCYVMEKVEGLIIRDRLPAELSSGRASTSTLGRNLIDVLAGLHDIDVDGIGLSDFGRPNGYLERQVGRWRAQSHASRTEDASALDRLGSLLAGGMPADAQEATLVHGDYRLDNCILHPSMPSEVAAVLDWEMSALGDPLTDLGMLLLYWREPDEREISLTPTVTHLPGFPRRSELLERYATLRPSVGLENITWYEAFAHYKFAVIVQGIAARISAGAMAGQDFGDLDGEVTALVESGLSILAGRGR